MTTDELIKIIKKANLDDEVFVEVTAKTPPFIRKITAVEFLRDVVVLKIKEEKDELV